jgi:hypothetical protein
MEEDNESGSERGGSHRGTCGVILRNNMLRQVGKVTRTTNSQKNVTKVIRKSSSYVRIDPPLSFGISLARFAHLVVHSLFGGAEGEIENFCRRALSLPGLDSGFSVGELDMYAFVRLRE